jgi:hypothetical protein
MSTRVVDLLVETLQLSGVDTVVGEMEYCRLAPFASGPSVMLSPHCSHDAVADNAHTARLQAWASGDQK